MSVNREGLLPCPFCGGEASLGVVKYSDKSDVAQLNGQSAFHFVNCIVCGATSRGILGAKDQREAAERWNRRALLTETRGADTIVSHDRPT